MNTAIFYKTLSKTLTSPSSQDDHWLNLENPFFASLIQIIQQEGLSVMDLMNNKLQKTVHLEKVDARLQFLLNTEDECVVKSIRDYIGLDPTN